MTLEQRVEALEKELAGMKAQQKADEEVGELMRKLTEEAIKESNRPGGVLYAAQKRAASENLVSTISTRIKTSRLFSQFS